MTKSKFFFIFSLSFIGGIGVSSFYYPKILNLEFIWYIIIAAIIFMAVFYENKKVVTIVATIMASILFFVSGVFLVNGKITRIKSLNQDGQNFSGQVMIVKEPENREKYQKIVVRPIEFESTPKFLLNVFDMTDYEYGDILEVSCELKTPENFSEDFDYQMYLAKDGIFYECQKPKIEKQGENKGNKIYAFILLAKNKLNENITKLIPFPEAGLLSGLILGGDNLLSKTYQEYFSRTGLTHIVAVSGYNVTIVAEYLMLLGIFLGLWRRQAFWFAAMGIIIFVVMTGLPSSAVRAGAMGILIIWAMKNGRLANARNAIIFSAAVMLLVNPLLLRWDVGFQLSFLATLGIVYLYPIFQNFFMKKLETKNIFISGALEIFLLTMAAQIFVLPIILFNFKKLSLISPLANLLVLPVIPATMMLGFLAAIFGFIFAPLAAVFSWLAFLPLRYETLAVKIMAGLKYASVEVQFSWWGVVLWYIILMYFMKYAYAKAKNNL